MSFMSAAAFNLGEVEFWVSTPDELGVEEWRDIQALERRAFADAMPGRRQGEIDYLVQADDLEGFIGSRLDPMQAVSAGRLRPDNNYADPRVVLATAGDVQELIGYGYAANNTSGRTGIERHVKMMGVAKKYAWLREVVVAPEAQRHGVARVMAGLLLDGFDPRQPVSAYTWIENDAGMQLASRLGLQATGQSPDRPFGPDSASTYIVRWAAGSVESIQQHLNKSSGIAKVLAAARQN